MRIIISKFLIILSLAVMILAASVDARADNAPAVFFSALADIPAMRGLVELEDYTLAYDKPEGRIIEMVARIDGYDYEDVRDYYKSTLPELGWTAKERDIFTRGGEQIRFDYDTEEDNGEHYKFVRITVEPLLR